MEKKLGAERVLLFSSGMSAISTTIMALLEKDTQIIYGHECYRKTQQFFESLQAKLGLPVIGVSFDGLLDAITKKTHPYTNTVVFIETPSNPLLKLADLNQLVIASKNHDRPKSTTIVVDSTMASPFFLHPRDYGADIEIHSATKYLGGHDSIFSGVVAGKAELLNKIHDMRSIAGGISSPFDLALLQEQMETFEIRLQALSEKGLTVAKFLAEHHDIKKVHYPGLTENQYYPIALEWVNMNGRRVNEDGSIPFGSVVSFELVDESQLESFANKVGLLGVNFGGTHTILDPFGYRATPETRGLLKISPSLFRLSVGLDYSTDEICSLIENALI